MAYLELEQVTKQFGDVMVVHDMSLSAKAGEFIVLVGASGCGKSTTLRMIAGLESPSSGRIVIDGRDVTTASPADRDIAMVFQNYALYPHMNVAKNMSFALELSGTPKAVIAQRVKDAAKILNIEHLLDRKPKELSGGQRQRVAMGRSIVREPKVFLFDEPLSNLDAKLRGHMRIELAMLHQRLGKTTVYVTHDQIEAMTLADRIVVMDLGRVQQIGTPDEVFNRPNNRFVAGFIGSPVMNFLSATVRQQAQVLRLQGRGWTCDVPEHLRSAATQWVGQTWVLGVRPQALRLGAVERGLTLPMQVQVCEYLGTESVLSGFIEDASGESPQALTLCAPGNMTHLIGQKVTVHAPLAEVFAFQPGDHGPRLGD